MPKFRRSTGIAAIISLIVMVTAFLAPAWSLWSAVEIQFARFWACYWLAMGWFAWVCDPRISADPIERVTARGWGGWWILLFAAVCALPATAIFSPTILNGASPGPVWPFLTALGTVAFVSALSLAGLTGKGRVWWSLTIPYLIVTSLFAVFVGVSIACCGAPRIAP
jgi:hypothetical protein